MIGYIVQPGDNLWSIAKKYRMSIERIREVNQDNKTIRCVIQVHQKWIRHSFRYTKAAKNRRMILAQSQDKNFFWCDKRIVIGNIRIMIG